MELPDRVQDVAPSGAEVFDRMAFAARALSLLRLPNTKIALCEGSRAFALSGRQWGGAPGERWAIVSVPRYASRRAISEALLSLSPPDLHRPWALDVLLHEPGTR